MCRIPGSRGGLAARLCWVGVKLERLGSGMYMYEYRAIDVCVPRYKCYEAVGTE